ncbi:MAG TPA: alpha/beta hydrolase [Croceibacterium sp.]|nr:alpha/beta hydrolase [Croceibacterium sp.]
MTGLTLAAALAIRSGIAPAQTAAAGGGLTIDQRLAPIAPELRPAARRMLENGFPPITAEVLRTLPAGAGGPMPELLPAIPVAERQVKPVGALPGVTVFTVNADPAHRRPAILHIHGGGFLVGNARGELRYLQEIAQTLDCMIVTVEYRLSPKARYTEATEDTYAGLKWLHDHADELGADRGRIAVMGESAGGGHAAMLAIKARDRGEIPLVFQALVYPMLDDRTGSAGSIPPHIATVGWSPPENRLGWASFLGVEPGGPDVPVAAVPARLDNLAGLPPAWIGVGGVDLFASEDIEYARRLTLANVPTELLVVPGGFHGFDRVASDTSLARDFTRSKLDALRRAFGGAAA